MSGSALLSEGNHDFRLRIDTGGDSQDLSRVADLVSAVRVGEQILQLAENFKSRGGAKRKVSDLRGDSAVLVYVTEG